MRLSLLAILAWSWVGCAPRIPEPQPLEASYPLRQDYLVVKAPVSPVSGWNEPGMPPLLSLDLPVESLNADQKALRTQMKKDGIIDTRQLNSEDKPGIEAAMHKLFGTPVQPTIPNSSDSLKKAIAELKLDPQTLAHGSRVYANYCANCHGSTGNGNGPGGKYLNPLPRDYRQGLFKFVSSFIPSNEEQTARGIKPEEQTPKFLARPLREDLRRTITRGFNGAPMPGFELSEDDLEAVISQVIFLSIRGETEYVTLKTAIVNDEPVEQPEKLILSNLEAVASRWAISQKWPMAVDPDPIQTGDPGEVLERKLLSAANGYEIFNGVTGGCTKCHTNYGKAAPYQYDEWGSIIRPRNLLVPILRGGSSPEAIYARIRGGISGANMPDHSVLLPNPKDPTTLGQHRLWDVVHFVEVLMEPRLLKQLKDPNRMKPLFNKYGRKEVTVVID
jgi:mono/diheme cytochrome c family protein